MIGAAIVVTTASATFLILPPSNTTARAAKRACEQMADGKIAGRIQVLREALSACALWSRRESVMALRDIATGNAPASERIQAIRELNLMHGYSEPERLQPQRGELSPIADADWL